MSTAQLAVDLGGDAIEAVRHKGGGADEDDIMRVRALAQLGLYLLAAHYPNVLVDGDRPRINDSDFDDAMRYMINPY